MKLSEKPKDGKKVPERLVQYKELKEKPEDVEERVSKLWNERTLFPYDEIEGYQTGLIVVRDLGDGEKKISYPIIETYSIECFFINRNGKPDEMVAYRKQKWTAAEAEQELSKSGIVLEEKLKLNKHEELPGNGESLADYFLHQEGTFSELKAKYNEACKN